MSTKGELNFEDLPPIEDLNLTVDENKCKPIGSVMNIVDAMVVIQSFPNTPTLDIDTVLFLDRGQRTLGKVFDVFGPVQEPLYCVRFNSQEHIHEKNIIKEMLVYCAPQSEFTSYVETSELLKNKGSDASWIDNNEPPSDYLEFSDDNDERKILSKSTIISKCEADSDSFVKKMNQRNLELTEKRKKEDEAKQKRNPLIKRFINNSSNSLEMTNMGSQTCFTQFTETYKQKYRTFTNNDQTRNFHHNPNAIFCNKIDSTRSVNYFMSGYNSSSNFTFPPPQHFLCSSTRQLPPPSLNVTPNPSNYLTMYSRPPIHPPCSAIPPFSTFNSSSIPTVPSFPSQKPPPSMSTPLPVTVHHHTAITQYSNFSSLPTPIPSSLQQSNFFQHTDASPLPQSAFIPLSVRPNISPTFHPQFVLSAGPPSLSSSIPQRDTRSDRRTVPPSMHTGGKPFYPSSPYNS